MSVVNEERALPVASGGVIARRCFDLSRGAAVVGKGYALLAPPHMPRIVHSGGRSASFTEAIKYREQTGWRPKEVQP